MLRRIWRFMPLMVATAVVASLDASTVAFARQSGPVSQGGRSNLGIAGAGKCGRWMPVDTPLARKRPNTLAAITAVSSSDMWAVGGQEDEVGFPQFTLAEHWNGQSWSIVRTPSPHEFSTDANFLNGVSAVDSDDAWAVGVHVVNGGTSKGTLIEHWDGTQWKVVKDHTGSLIQPALTSVAAISSDDVWAVGSSRNPANGEAMTLTEHWNGHAWKVMPSPNPEGNEDNPLFGVAASASDDVWVVGSANAHIGTLIEHFDGRRWRIVPSPSRSGFNTLLGVTALSRDDAWAVGSAGLNGQTLIEHWDGSSWTDVASPTPAGFTLLHGVDASSPDDVWAVGTAADQDQNTSAVAEHWNGSSWRLVAPPALSSGDGLNGVAALSSEQWAVGTTDDPDGLSRTLIEHRCDR